MFALESHVPLSLSDEVRVVFIGHAVRVVGPVIQYRDLVCCRGGEEDEDDDDGPSSHASHWFLLYRVIFSLSSSDLSKKVRHSVIITISFPKVLNYLIV